MAPTTMITSYVHHFARYRRIAKMSIYTAMEIDIGHFVDIFSSAGKLEP